MLKHLCPCCDHHCYLDEGLLCERGIEYKETGVIPPRKPSSIENTDRKKPAHSEKKMQYLALDCDSKIIWNLREMGNTISSLENANGSELLDFLRTEDRADLLMLLEKIKYNWHRLNRKK